jgi:peptidoglycan/xylan/chitin deacetylase (PgdA/CDA1 family)
VYHRVAETAGDQELELTPAIGRRVFQAELDYLRRRYVVVAPTSLHAAAAARRPGEAVPVALTFDDDTRSHVDEVLRMLDDAGMIAGFYLAGWSLAGAPRPWWETLQLAVDHERLVPSMTPLTDELVGAAQRRDPGALRRLGQQIELLDVETRRGLARRLAELTDDLAREQGLDRAAIRTLGDRHQVGFHTRGHDRLGPLDDDALARAISDGRTELEQAVGRPIDTIAYPHGDADARVAGAARDAGYVLGLAGFNRAVTASDDPLLMPRLSPWHASLGTFALTLAARTLRV